MLISTTFPVVYKANGNAWMTAVLFREWLIKFNERMTAQKKNLILFLDNASSHPYLDPLFFLANCTSLSNLQLQNQGIICHTRLHYKKKVLQRVLEAIDSAKS